MADYQISDNRMETTWDVLQTLGKFEKNKASINYYFSYSAIISDLG